MVVNNFRQIADMLTFESEDDFYHLQILVRKKDLPEYAKGKNNNGATLQTLANLMRDIGAWNAMNLDGGGSSMMTICNTNVCTNTTIPTGRRISAALALFRRSKLFKPHLIKHREQEE